MIYVGEFLVGLADDIIVMEAWYGFFCNANNTGREIFAGESFEASSASDPIFWAIHPAIERLVQAKLMLGKRVCRLTVCVCLCILLLVLQLLNVLICWHFGCC